MKPYLEILLQLAYQIFTGEFFLVEVSVSDPFQVFHDNFSLIHAVKQDEDELSERKMNMTNTCYNGNSHQCGGFLLESGLLSSSQDQKEVSMYVAATVENLKKKILARP